MASQLIDEIEEAPGSNIWVPSDARFSNLIPNGDVDDPIVSVVPNYTGRALADKYTVTFADVNLGTREARMFVNTISPNNPHRDLAGKVRKIDGATIIRDVAPGCDVVFSPSATFNDTWKAEIRIGTYFGTFVSYGEQAGVAGNWVKHRVRNISTGSATDCQALLMNMAQLVDGTGSVFQFIKPHAETAIEKVDSPENGRVIAYTIAVSNVAGAGANKTMDIRVDGALVTVRNLDTGAEALSQNLRTDVDYKVVSGGLNSLHFRLSESAVNADNAYVSIFNKRHIEIAPVVGDVPGTFGVVPVILTQPGLSGGTIDPGEAAYYAARPKVVEGSKSNSNPHICNVFAKGKLTGTAGWRG